MITGETPPNNVSHSEWTSRLDAMKDKIDWRDELPDLDYSKIYLFNPNLDKITTFRDELIQNKVLLSISVSNSSVIMQKQWRIIPIRVRGLKK